MEKTKNQKSGISRLLEIAGRRKWLLVLSGILAVIHAALALVPYILIYYILQVLLDGGQAAENADIFQLLLWAFIAVSTSALLMYASAMASHIAAFNILYELRCKIASKLGKLSMGYLNNRSTGELKKILIDDVERIETFVAHGIPDIIKAVCLPILVLAFLFTIDWRMALISLFPLVITCVASYFAFASTKSKALMVHYHKSLEDMNASISEYVRAMPVMKIFGQSASAFKQYSDRVNNYNKFIIEWTNMSAPVWGMLMSFLSNALLPLLVVGLVFYFNGTIKLSILFLFLILGVGYIRGLFTLVSLGPQINVIEHGVKRMDEILFDANEQTSGSKSLTDDFSIKVENLSFSYVDGIKVLDNINFSVPQGTITALVGPSGGGKTTMAELIARFYDVKEGAIKVGGIDINDTPMESLMDTIGFVFQDNMMFNQSLYDNIRMGAIKSMDEVIEASKVAQCHEFIMKLQNGYETKIGDSGIHLSGGEQQRIQLARVVLKDPKIIILDEATAFSDPINEHLIIKALTKIISNKTVVIIAHRLSTIQDVNQIVVLNQGKIDGCGTHNELLASCQLYKNMWEAHTRAKDFKLTRSVENNQIKGNL